MDQFRNMFCKWKPEFQNTTSGSFRFHYGNFDPEIWNPYAQNKPCFYLDLLCTLKLFYFNQRIYFRQIYHYCKLQLSHDNVQLNNIQDRAQHKLSVKKKTIYRSAYFSLCILF